MLGPNFCVTFLGMTEPRKVGRPATGQTPVRTLRLGAIWDEAKAAAEADGENLTSLVERAIRRELDRRAKRLHR